MAMTPTGPLPCNIYVVPTDKEQPAFLAYGATLTRTRSGYPVETWQLERSTFISYSERESKAIRFGVAEALDKIAEEDRERQRMELVEKRGEELSDLYLELNPNASPLAPREERLEWLKGILRFRQDYLQTIDPTASPEVDVWKVSDSDLRKWEQVRRRFSEKYGD